MVNINSLIYMAISLFLSFILPILGIIYLRRRYKASFLWLVMGIITFCIFQIFLRMPLLNYLSAKSWYVIYIFSNPIIYSVVLSLSAGLFEEIGRFLSFKVLLGNRQRWHNGIIFGLGHGGIESILFASIPMLNNIIISLNINYGWFEKLFNIQPALHITLNSVKNILINTPSHIFLVGGIERVLTIFIHIGLSLIVLEGVRNNKFSNVIKAIFIHTLVNIPAALIQTGILKINIMYVEIYLALFAIAFIIYILSKRDTWDFMM